MNLTIVLCSEILAAFRTFCGLDSLFQWFPSFIWERQKHQVLHMLAQKLRPDLKKKFLRFRIIEGTPPEPIAIIPPAHPSVGPVLIYDHGDEVTLVIKEITHGHFNPYDETLTEEQRTTLITEDVIDFLEELFEDKVLLWKTHDGSIGGWIRLLHIDSPPPLVKGQEYYVWSGPYIR